MIASQGQLLFRHCAAYMGDSAKTWLPCWTSVPQFAASALLQDEMEREVEGYLRRKYEANLQDVEVVWREDLDLVRVCVKHAAVPTTKPICRTWRRSGGGPGPGEGGCEASSVMLLCLGCFCTKCEQHLHNMEVVWWRALNS